MNTLLVSVVVIGKVSSDFKDYKHIIRVFSCVNRIIYCYCYSGAIAVGIVNGATLSKFDQPNPSEYDEKSCPRRCSEAYYPVCGINQNGDTKVFVNDCYMSMENCNQLAHQGTYVHLLDFIRG